MKKHILLISMALVLASCGSEQSQTQEKQVVENKPEVVEPVGVDSVVEKTE